MLRSHIGELEQQLLDLSLLMGMGKAGACHVFSKRAKRPNLLKSGQSADEITGASLHRKLRKAR